MNDSTSEKIKKAERVRDRVIHGKQVSDPDMRQAIIDVIEYAKALNKDLKAAAGFEPFGDLRGFKGRAQSLEKSTTIWLLKGLGFTGGEIRVGKIGSDTNFLQARKGELAESFNPFSCLINWMLIEVKHPSVFIHSSKISCKAARVALKVLAETAPSFLARRILSTVRI
ncbi:hypothetical protein H0I39_17405 [Ottowia beijingensis]|uniref:Uncharacterized protein n=1 Tax=Ottowia beijingensis TaxID=1207057 RepID=A0A853IRG1_9BURK|nr:hypothetical protein [Ottowia beijingensis]NZA03056.1 hypothetical protein [Ottowia beijingensis]